jgi:hypothetical protein
MGSQLWFSEILPAHTHNFSSEYLRPWPIQPLQFNPKARFAFFPCSNPQIKILSFLKPEKHDSDKSPKKISSKSSSER